MIAFNCPGCHKDFQAKDEFAGRKTKCPQCGTALLVPNSALPPASQPSPRAEATSASCSKCGETLQTGARFCSSCGAPTSKQQGVPLFPCHACGRQVSSQAASCPACGQPTFEYSTLETYYSPWNEGSKERGQQKLDGVRNEGWEVVEENDEEDTFQTRDGEDAWGRTTKYKLRRSLLKPR